MNSGPFVYNFILILKLLYTTIFLPFYKYYDENSHKFQEISSFNYRCHEFDKSSLLVNLRDNVPISSRSGMLVPWVYKTLRASEKGWNERFAETIETVTGLLVVGQPAGDSVKISRTSHQRIPLCVPGWIELINFFETVFLWQLDIPEIHRLIFKTSRGKIR